MTAFDALGSRDEARAARLVHGLTPLAKVKPSLAGRYLVKNFLDRGAFSCLFGASNVGKSFLALDLAVHVSAGEAWFGHRIAKGVGPALYVCAEGNAGFGLRVAALRAARPDLVRRAEASGMLILPVPLDLCEPDDAAALVELIVDRAETQPSLVVVDTLARSMGSGDENSGPDMAALVGNASLMQARLGAHVMLIHHSGKNEARGMRGHSSLRAALDSEIELSRADASKVTTVTTRKQRDLEFGEAIHFVLRRVEIGRDEDGDPVTSAVVVQSEAPQPGKGAIAQNAERKAQAAGRADAALRLCPVGRDFGAGEVAESFAKEGIVKDADAKSVRENARAKLKSMVAAGLLVQAERGQFRIVDGGRP